MSGLFTIAVHALVYLNRRGKTLSSEELAENICTHSARVRKVMSMLHHAGLVEVQTGAHGGYRFALDPSKVTLRAVCEAVDDAPVPAGWRSGGLDTPCLIASGMAGVMDELRDDLNAACRDRLAVISIAEIDRRLFHQTASATPESTEGKCQ